MEIHFEAIEEDQPGKKWRGVFDRHWHAYSRWFLHNGIGKRATYLQSLRAMRTYMPELGPVYDRICEAAGGGDLEARFLSMWCPPAYVGGCSQVIITGDEPALIRNYDYSPKLLEGTVLASRYLGKRVVSTTDCLWGVLDGVNEDGLATSLSFGGRQAVGEGFGIPLVLRYVLELAADVSTAVEILGRVPIHMSYTIALLDRHGDCAMVFVNPDRKIEVVDQRVATNHQRRPAWHRHAATTRSVEREFALSAALRNANRIEPILAAFLEPPVFQTAYGRGYGTLYTSVYRSTAASVEYVWPSFRWEQSCSSFLEGRHTEHLVYDINFKRLT